MNQPGSEALGERSDQNLSTPHLSISDPSRRNQSYAPPTHSAAIAGSRSPTRAHASLSVLKYGGNQFGRALYDTQISAGHVLRYSPALLPILERSKINAEAFGKRCLAEAEALS